MTHEVTNDYESYTQPQPCQNGEIHCYVGYEMINNQKTGNRVRGCSPPPSMYPTA